MNFNDLMVKFTENNNYKSLQANEQEQLKTLLKNYENYTIETTTKVKNELERIFNEKRNELKDREQWGTIASLSPFGIIYSAIKGTVNGISGLFTGASQMITKTVENVNQVFINQGRYGNDQKAFLEEVGKDLLYVLADPVLRMGESLQRAGYSIENVFTKDNEKFNEKLNKTSNMYGKAREFFKGTTQENPLKSTAVNLLEFETDKSKFSEEVSNDLMKDIAVAGNWFSTQIAPKIANIASFGVGDFIEQNATSNNTKFFNETMESIGRMIPAIAASYFGDAGATASSIYFFGSSFGSSFNEAISKGASVEEAYTYAYGNAIIETLTEQIGGVKIGKILPFNADKSFVMNIIKSAIEEGSEEVMSEIASAGLEHIISGEEANNDDIVARGVRAFLGGALSGGILTGAGGFLTNKTSIGKVQNLNEEIRKIYENNNLDIEKTKKEVTKRINTVLKSFNSDSILDRQMVRDGKATNEEIKNKKKELLDSSISKLLIEYNEKDGVFELSDLGKKITTDFEGFIDGTQNGVRVNKKDLAITKNVDGGIEYDEGVTIATREEIENLKDNKKKNLINSIINDNKNRNIVFMSKNDYGSVAFFSNESGVIYIDYNLPSASIEAKIATHEVVHKLKTLNKKAYDKITKLIESDKVQKALKDNGVELLTKKEEKDYRKVYSKEIKDQKVVEELIREEKTANFIENIITNPKMVEKLLGVNPDLVAELDNSTRDMLKNVEGKLKKIEKIFTKYGKQAIRYKEGSLIKALSRKVAQDTYIKVGDKVYKISKDNPGFFNNENLKGYREASLNELHGKRIDWEVFGEGEYSENSKKELKKFFELFEIENGLENNLDAIIENLLIEYDDLADYKEIIGTKYAYIWNITRENQEMHEAFKEKVYPIIEKTFEDNVKMGKIKEETYFKGLNRVEDAKVFRKIFALNQIVANPNFSASVSLYSSFVYENEAEHMYLFNDGFGGFIISKNQSEVANSYKNGYLRKFFTDSNFEDKELASVFNNGKQKITPEMRDFIIKVLGVDNIIASNSKLKSLYESWGFEVKWEVFEYSPLIMSEWSNSYNNTILQNSFDNKNEPIFVNLVSKTQDKMFKLENTKDIDEKIRVVDGNIMLWNKNTISLESLINSATINELKGTEVYKEMEKMKSKKLFGTRENKNINNAINEYLYELRKELTNEHDSYDLEVEDELLMEEQPHLGVASEEKVFLVVSNYNRVVDDFVKYLSKETKSLRINFHKNYYFDLLSNNYDERIKVLETTFSQLKEQKSKHNRVIYVPNDRKILQSIIERVKPGNLHILSFISNYENDFKTLFLERIQKKEITSDFEKYVRTNTGIINADLSSFERGGKYNFYNTIINENLFLRNEVVLSNDNLYQSYIEYKKNFGTGTNSKQVEEYFKDSLVRDEHGNLLVMNHNSESSFNEFDYSYMGSNGTVYGIGIYTSSTELHEYGDYNNKVYVNITKDASEKRFTKQEFKAILEGVYEKLGNITKEGIGFNLKEYRDFSFIQLEEEYGDNVYDRDYMFSEYLKVIYILLERKYEKLYGKKPEFPGNLGIENLDWFVDTFEQVIRDKKIDETVQEILSSRYNFLGDTLTNEIITEKTGYDGYLVIEYGTRISYAVAFNKDQVKYVTNQYPTKTKRMYKLLDNENYINLKKMKINSINGDNNLKIDKTTSTTTIVRGDLSQGIDLNTEARILSQNLLNEFNKFDKNEYAKEYDKKTRLLNLMNLKEIKELPNGVEKVEALKLVEEKRIESINKGMNRLELYNHIVDNLTKEISFEIKENISENTFDNKEKMLNNVLKSISKTMAYLDTTFRDNDLAKNEPNNPEGYQYNNSFFRTLRELKNAKNKKDFDKLLKRQELTSILDLLDALVKLDIKNKDSIGLVKVTLNELIKKTGIEQKNSMALQVRNEHSYSINNVLLQNDVHIETMKDLMGENTLISQDGKIKKYQKKNGLLGKIKIFDKTSTALLDMYAFGNSFGLFMKDSLGNKIVQRIEEGQKQQLKVTNRFYEFFEKDGFLKKNNKKINALEKEIVEIENLKDDNKNNVSLPKSQVISIRNILLREIIRNRAIENGFRNGEVSTHFKENGFIFINGNSNDRLKNKENRRQVKLTNAIDLFNELNKIINEDSFMKEYNEKILEFYDVLYEFENERNKDITGLELMSDKKIIERLTDAEKEVLLDGLEETKLDYIYSPMQTIGANPNQTVGAFNINTVVDLGVNDGMVLGITTSNNAPLIDSINLLLPRYVRNVANYYGLYRVTNDLNILFNKEITLEDGSQISLERKMESLNPDFVKYFEKLLRDVTGYSIEQDTTTQKMNKVLRPIRVNFYKATLGANIKVIMTQFSSMFTIANMYGGLQGSKTEFFTIFTKNLFAKGSKTKAKYLIENSEIYKDRARNSTYEMTQATSSAFARSGFNEFTEMLMSGITLTDNMINRAFFVSLVEVGYSEQQALEITEEAINRYQSSGLAINKNQLLRVDNELVKIFTKFLGEPMKVISNIKESMLEQKVIKAFKENKTEIIENENKKVEKVEKYLENLKKRETEIQKSLSEEKDKNKVKELKKEARKTESKIKQQEVVLDALEANLDSLEKGIDEVISKEKESKEIFGRRVTSLIISLLWQTTLGVGFNILRKGLKDKDEEEEMWKYLGSKFGWQLASEAIGYLPFIRDIYTTIVNNYDANAISDFQAFNDLGKTINRITTDIANGGNFDYGKHIRNVSIQLGQVFGLPTRQIERLFTTPSNYLFKEANYVYRDITGQQTTNKELNDAIKNNDTKLIETIIERKLDDRKVKLTIITEREIQKLAKKGTIVLPTTIPNSFTIDGIEYKNDKSKFNEVYSNASFVVEKIIDTQGYNSLDDEHKGLLIKAIFNYYYGLAKQEVSGVKVYEKERTYTLNQAYNYFKGRISYYKNLQSKKNKRS